MHRAGDHKTSSNTSQDNAPVRRAPGRLACPARGRAAAAD
eukprot:CAMPEP_0198517596 /NCGR_PEP_ID=MMETSP1462-20131121/18618_1 /TAXON_ID=1333877 /ORGANISM="Brandtodinium nutriculum, Strain RCC3387" /LENGTH=39 /DNA_ID= /DNA_START= /DNA_END= /DNA_ORIENTATION=